MSSKEAKRLVDVGHAILVSEDEKHIKICIPMARYKLDSRAPREWRPKSDVYYTVFKSV